MLGRRRRRRASIEPALGQRLVLVGNSSLIKDAQQTRDNKQCCFGVGTPPTTLAQHQENIGST